MTIPKVKISTFDASLYLKSEEDMAGYLHACLEEGGPALFVEALGDVAKAKGMAQLARDTGLGRESLYKSLAPGSKPRFETIVKITSALGLSLDISSAR